MKNIKAFFLLIAITLLLVPASRAQAETIIMDHADILSSAEEESLKQTSDQILSDTGVSIYIYTDPELSMSDDYDGLSVSFQKKYDADDVVMLTVGMCPGDRVYAITGFGKGMDYVNNRRADKIADGMQDDMRNGSYYSAFSYFLSKTDTDLNRDPMFDSILFSPLVQLPFFLILAAAICAFMVMGSRGKITTNSRTYMDNDNSKLIGHFDRYIRTSVTRVKRQSSSSSGGGGGGGHSSSGGHSF